MKRLFLILIAIVFVQISLLGQKKWEVGDIVLDYEIPAVVVYVDDTGEHGILLGLHKYPEYLNEHGMLEDLLPFMMKPELLQKYFSEELPFEYNFKRDKKGQITMTKSGFVSIKGRTIDDEKKLSEAYRALADCGLTKGKEIAKFINEYCAANQMDKSVYFRTQYWADCLGDGWFIPGDEELKLISPTINGHPVGEEFPTPVSASKKSYKQYQEDIFTASFAYKIYNNWDDKDKTQMKAGGVLYNCIHGFHFSPCIRSANISFDGKVHANHFLVIARTKENKNCIFKPIISYGIKSYDLSLYKEFGKYMCFLLHDFPYYTGDSIAKDPTLGVVGGGYYAGGGCYDYELANTTIKISTLPIREF